MNYEWMLLLVLHPYRLVCLRLGVLDFMGLWLRRPNIVVCLLDVCGMLAMSLVVACVDFKFSFCSPPHLSMTIKWGEHRHAPLVLNP